MAIHPLFVRNLTFMEIVTSKLPFTNTSEIFLAKYATYSLFKDILVQEVDSHGALQK
jgi:hypothetical protein